MLFERATPSFKFKNNPILVLVSFLILLQQINLIQCQDTDSSSTQFLKSTLVLEKKYESLMSNESNFYNYSLVCGGPESRISNPKNIDKNIPDKYRTLIMSTLDSPKERANKCPSWNNAGDSGSMESLTIPENTKVGTHVYTLSAVDPDGDALKYFVRKSEVEQARDPLPTSLFNVTTIRSSNSWLGKVVLAREIDYEKVKTYNYLTYAFDGENLIERYSTIDITDVDDEKPSINTVHPNYDPVKKMFRFSIYENASLGEVLNAQNKLVFDDVDTQPSQLKVKLAYVDTGLTDSPFMMSNMGELKAISSLDYEVQKDYFLKITVRDVPGNYDEQLLHIEILDVADLPPVFVAPNETEHDFKFFEKKTGPVFSFRAASMNAQPLDEIRYTIAHADLRIKDFIGLRKHADNDTWYLEFTKPYSLLDQDKEESYSITVRAYEVQSEAADLRKLENFNSAFITDRKFTVTIVSDDICPPQFDREVYEFSVIENEVSVLEPILVSDCDHGNNGHIYVSTSNPNFVFKVNQMYREGRLALQMVQAYDYEKVPKSAHSDDRIIEFNITAQGSNASYNNFVTHARVQVYVKSINEFAPRFVIPPPKNATERSQNRMYSYKTPENDDFTLEVLAVDGDEGNDGQIAYSVEFLHEEDRLALRTNFSNVDNKFRITVPGQFLDAHTKVPIMFVVIAKDLGQTSLTDQIIVSIKAEPVDFRPVIFVHESYEFSLRENTNESTFQPFKLKLTDDNLNRSRILIEEVKDPLNLISFQFEPISDDMDDVVSERTLLLFPTNFSRDFDELFVLNQRSNEYSYRLRATVEEKKELISEVEVIFKLIDDNDNKPYIVGEKTSSSSSNDVIKGSMSEHFVPNSYVNISKAAKIRFDDGDFSDDFGRASLFFRVNDTRFQMENEEIEPELSFPNLNRFIKIVAGRDQFDINKEPYVYLNVTCEDNYFNRRFNKQPFWTKSIVFRIDLVDTNNFDPVFSRDIYLFEVNENWVGQIGEIKATDKDPADTIHYEILPHQDQVGLIEDYFAIVNNHLVLQKPFDFEIGQRYFNFTIVARNDRPPQPPAIGSACVPCIVIVRDQNDNAPEWSMSAYNFTVKRKVVPANQHIGSIFATDLDRVDWSHLEFTILGDDFTSIIKDKSITEIFALEPIKAASPHLGPGNYGMLQGVTLVNRVELRENPEKKNNPKLRQPDYQFQIAVSDKSGHRSTATVRVELSSESSRFRELEWTGAAAALKGDNIYSASVRENSPKDTFVVQVQVKQETLTKPIMDTLRFKLTQPNPYYRIDETTGKIYTTDVVIDREDSNSMNQGLQTFLFVQASYTLKKEDFSTQDDDAANAGASPEEVKARKARYVDADTTYWSTLASVQIEILDDNDNRPDVIVPPNNRTFLVLDSDKLLNAKDRLQIFKFMALDRDFDDSITYKLVGQNSFAGNFEDLDLSNTKTLFGEKSKLSLPFVLDSRTGELTFNASLLTQDDLITLLDHPDDVFKICLSVNAVDKAQNAALVFLFIEIKFEELDTVIRTTSKAHEEMPPIDLVVAINNNSIVESFVPVRQNKTGAEDATTTVDDDLNINLNAIITDSQAKGSARIIENKIMATPVRKNATAHSITYDFLVSELTEPNTVIAQVVPLINQKATKRMPTQLKLVPTSLIENPRGSPLRPAHDLPDALASKDGAPVLVNETEIINDYFNYDPINGVIKLKRRLNHAYIKNISFSLVDPQTLANLTSVSATETGRSTASKSIGEAPKQPISRVNFNIFVKDENDQVPVLDLDDQEVKEGKNLVLVSIDNVQDLLPPAIKERFLPKTSNTSSSSTQLPPHHEMPMFSEEVPEFIQTMLEFNKRNELKAYKIIDSDEVKNFSVRFTNKTSPEVVKKYEVLTNGTHVIFKNREPQSTEIVAGDIQVGKQQTITSTASTPLSKTAATTPQDDENAHPTRLFDKFTIELDDGKHKTQYDGDIYNLDAVHIKRILTFLPKGERYQGTIYRSTMSNTKIDVEPAISIKNPFPFDLRIELTDKSQNDYIQFHPHQIKSDPENQLVGPVDLLVSMKKPLSSYPEKADWSRIDVGFRLTSNNSYANKLLDTLGQLQVNLNILDENKYQPKIASIQPMNATITLVEGFYDKHPIGKIRAIDKDARDPGRLEYYLIGPSSLEINRTSGEIYISGNLDAESSEQVIVFYCYARDMAPKPFAMQSDLVEFKLIVQDKNEYAPVFQPSSVFVIVKEEDSSVVYPNFVREFEFTCFDRDYSSDVEMVVDSVRFVSIFNQDVVVTDTTSGTNTIDKSSVRLVFENSTDADEAQNVWRKKSDKRAHLAFTHKIDFESLVRPNETLIHINVYCTDGLFRVDSKVLIKVEDINDNRPKFTGPANMVIYKDESVQSQEFAVVSASDNDLSSQYGNLSLAYSMLSCSPDSYNIDVNRKTGYVFTNILIDADTPELIENRRLQYVRDKSSINNVYQNNITCTLSVRDSFGVANVSFEDTMNITILIVNVNDNAPVIHLDKATDNPIEVVEGTSTRGLTLTQVAVTDIDDATGLKCLFINGRTFYDIFEIRTYYNATDPHKASCLIKVSDEQYISYDPIKKANFLLDVVVEDRARPPMGANPGRTTAQIRIKVIPVNDKPPQFINGQEETFYTIDSARPGAHLGTILATDSESTNPDRLTYEIDEATNPSGLFKLVYENSTNNYWGSVSLVTTQKLDVKASPYTLKVVAYDGPKGMKDTLSSSKTVHVYVINKGTVSVWVNATNGDEIDYYKVNLDELSPADTLVVKIQVVLPILNPADSTAPSSSSSSSNDVVYAIETNEGAAPNPFYKIDSKTGEIRTTSTPIEFRESEPARHQMARELRVKASSADGYHNYHTFVSLNIIDVNDHAPVFDRFADLNVVENTTGRFVIGRVHASDLDSGLNALVKYSIDYEASTTSPSAKGLFDINESTGEVIVINGNEIDRELLDFYNLTIVATDQGSPTKSVADVLAVRVLDINDNEPQFEASLLDAKFEIVENTLNFSQLLTAHDADLGSNGTVFYFIDGAQSGGEDIQRKFIIDPMTGRLSLNSPLDYEEKSVYEFVVVAVDNGNAVQLRNQLTVRIEVIDVDDNRPLFSLNPDNQKMARIVENAPADTKIAEFRAVDKDKNPNTAYAIKSVIAHKRLRRQSGVDADEPASDAESEAQSVEVNGDDLFSLDSETGVLRLKDPSQLSYSNVTQYTITIEAFEKLAPAGSSSVQRDQFNFTLEVLPSNDKLPVFVPTNTFSVTIYRGTLTESAEQSLVVEIVKAIELNEHQVRYYLEAVDSIDADDASANATVDYTTTTTASPRLFSIGEKDGVIKAIQPRSLYTADSYVLHVTAVSTLNKVLTAKATVHVVMDNSRDSFFEKPVYECSVEENSDANVQLIQLVPKNKTLTKSLRYKLNDELSVPTQVSADWFKIDKFTGVISTNSRNIDYEKYSEVLLTINVYDAKDENSSKKKATIESVLCKIRIVDLNDNRPTFDIFYRYEVVVDEDDELSAKSDRKITHFSAFDLDGTAPNNLVNYSISSIETANGKNVLGKLATVSFKLEPHESSRMLDEPYRGNEVKLVKMAGFNMDRDVYGNEIRITVMASDNGVNPGSLESLRVIRIVLKDLNDNPPVITNMDNVDSIAIPENQTPAKPFFHIQAVDKDEGLNGALVYEIENEITVFADPRSNMRLNQERTKHISIDQNGYLWLMNELDFEREHEIDVDIKIYDKSPASQKIRKSLTINITNINDNAPQFIAVPKAGLDAAQIAGSDNYECILSAYEGPSSSGLVLNKFQAFDADNLPGPFTFELLDVSTQVSKYDRVPTSKKLTSAAERLFTIEPDSGLLKVKSGFELDRETIDNYQLLISLKDQPLNGVQMETKLKCFLQVLDINDNAPVFDANLNTEIQILPLVNKINTISSIVATDLDLGNNGTVVYDLEVSTKPDAREDSDYNRRLFDIDSRGHFVMRPFTPHSDAAHPDLNDVYYVTVIAGDLGTPTRMQSRLNVVVKIDPNYYHFDQLKSSKEQSSVENLRLQSSEGLLVEVKENVRENDIITRISAINSLNELTRKSKNAAVNRQVTLTYRLVTSDKAFKIDPETGDLSVRDPSLVDYEAIKNYWIVIEAVEEQKMATIQQNRTGQLNVFVKIRNVNDNAPEFNSFAYEGTIQENEPRVPYEVALNQTIIISDRDVDRIDLPADQMVPLEVKLVGSDSRHFELIPLDPRINSIGDAAEGNGDFYYKLRAYDRFDYENKARYEFRIEARDGIHTSSVNVVIKIDDLNDNDPEFERKFYEFNIPESSAPNTFIGKVKASDRDVSERFNEIIYVIESVWAAPGPIYSEKHDLAMLVGNKVSNNLYRDTDSQFKLDRFNGDLLVNYGDQKLDRESVLYYNLTIAAINKENRERKDTCVVIINLNDINDNAPKFGASEYRVELMEKSSVGRVILRLNATDNDSSENGTVRYKIEAINQRKYGGREIANYFVLNAQDGSLKVNQLIDIDSNDFKNFEIDVVAYDAGSVSLSDRCKIYVRMLDVNDHTPTFINPNDLVIEVKENNPIGMNAFPLLNLNAQDLDYTNPRLVYSIEPDARGDSKYFRIDRDDGHIYANVSFDYEEKQEFNIRITVADSGFRYTESGLDSNNVVNDSSTAYPFSLSSSINVQVKVIDVDDNEPEFSAPEKATVFTVNENLEPGSSIGSIPSAKDRDPSPENNQIKYFVLSGNEDGRFLLNETTGEIKLVDYLEIQEKSVYEFVIKATSKHINSIADLSAVVSQRSVKGQAQEDNSVTKVVIRVTRDDVFMEFNEYYNYVSYQLLNESILNMLVNADGSDVNMTSLRNALHVTSEETNNIVLTSQQESQLNISDLVSAKKLLNSAIFFSRAHLNLKKENRKVSFSIDALKVIPFGKTSAIKLEDSLFANLNNTDAKFAPRSTALYKIDQTTGKVYANKDLLQRNYKYGDRFIVTIVARSDKSSLTTTAELFVTLTMKMFSFVLPMDKPESEILSIYLNPKRQEYLPRELEVGGAKLCIQDLSPATSDSASTENLLIMQAYIDSKKEFIDLDFYKNLAGKFPTLSDLLKQLQTVKSRESNEHLTSNYSVDPFDSRGSFYTNWLFWLLVIISVLLAILVVIIICCIKSNNKKHTRKSKKSTLVVDYPGDISPTLNNGYDINRKRSTSRNFTEMSRTVRQPVSSFAAARSGGMGHAAVTYGNADEDDNFEDQEMVIDLNYDSDE